jgi:uncharacterized protein YukE
MRGNMTTLHMQTETVHAAARSLKSNSEIMQAGVQSLRGAVENLYSSWRGSSSEEFHAETESLLKRLASQAEAISLLADRLAREVQEWEAVDQRGAQGSMTSVFMGSGLSSFAAMPAAAGGRAWSLPFNATSILPLTTSVSIAALIAGIPAWLSGFMDRFFGAPEVISPLGDPGRSPAPPTPSGRKTFGDLLNESPPSATASGAPVAPVDSPASKYDTYYDVPLKSQGDLYGNAGCSPTSVSMVTDYFHAQDPSNATATPAELITSLDKGDGTPGSGISLSNMTDELGDLGYENVTTKVNANLEDLKSALGSGPVIVTSGVSIVGPGTAASGVARDITGPGGVIHAMVVKGISEQNVAVNDPWSGMSKDIPMDTFSKMWNNGSNGMVVIRP